MNIVINKLDLPCDMKRIIYDFIYDSNGYNQKQLDTIKEIKNKSSQITQNLRMKLELREWYRVDKNTIKWLRYGGVYNKVTGLGGLGGYEMAVFAEAYYHGLLPGTVVQPKNGIVIKAEGLVRRYQGLVYKHMGDIRLEEIRIYGHTL